MFPHCNSSPDIEICSHLFSKQKEKKRINTVYLLPVYKPPIHRQPTVTRRVKRWSNKPDEALKDRIRQCGNYFKMLIGSTLAVSQTK